MTNSEATAAQRIFGQVNSLMLPAALKLLNIRLNHYDRSVDPARPEYNQHVVFTFWHEYISVMLTNWAHTPLTILTSQHRDGEYVSQIGEYSGVHVVRGSTSRGGAAAIRQLKKHTRFSSVAITPDGPRGPRREMAMGPIYLASLLKVPIVPVGVGMDRPWRLNTWDRFAIPRPFSRVRVIFGPKINLPRQRDKTVLEDFRLKLQQITNDLSRAAEDWATSGQKMRGEQRLVRSRRRNQMFFDRPARSVRDLARLPITTPRAA